MPVIVLPDTVAATVKVLSASSSTNFFSALEEMLFTTVTTPSSGALVTVPLSLSENTLYASDAME